MSNLNQFINTNRYYSMEKLNRLAKPLVVRYRKDCFLYGGSCFEGVKFNGLPTEEEMIAYPPKARAVELFYQDVKNKPKPWFVMMAVFLPKTKGKEGEYEVVVSYKVTKPTNTAGVSDIITDTTQEIVNKHPNNLGYGWCCTQSKTYDLRGSEDTFLDFLVDSRILDQLYRAEILKRWYEKQMSTVLNNG